MKRGIVPAYTHHVVQHGVRSMNILPEYNDRNEHLGFLSLGKVGEAALALSLVKRLISLRYYYG